MKALADDLFNKLENFTTALSEAPVPQSDLFKLISWLIGQFSSKNKNIPDLKKAIADQLRNEQKRILVVVDDIDRLTSEEIW